MTRSMQSWAGRIGLAAVLAALAIPFGAQAQGTGSPGDGAGCPSGPCPGAGRGGRAGARRFDPGAVTTLQGEVTEVQRVARRRHSGVHLAVATASGTTVVALGPDFYVDAQGVTLGKGDHVEVTGWKVSGGGGPTFVAQQVKRGGDVLKLRSAAGVPLWAGQRGR